MDLFGFILAVLLGVGVFSVGVLIAMNQRAAQRDAIMRRVRGL